MITHLEGNLVEKTPTYAVIDCSGVGYLMNISLNTYARLPDEGRCKLYTHQVIREDAHTLYGFWDQEERSVFRHLITVQGVGPNTARMILSSLTVREVFQAISFGQVEALHSVKGIGAKTAQKIVLELKDKLTKEDIQAEFFPSLHNSAEKEALSALMMLGFVKAQAEKAVKTVLKSQGQDISLEDLIKACLKIL
jgi:Holliday junction DNA helicase RuvA